MSLAASLSYSGEFGRSLELAARAVDPPRGRRQGGRDEPAGRPAPAGRAGTPRRCAPSMPHSRPPKARATPPSSARSGPTVSCCSAGPARSTLPKRTHGRALELFESQGWTKRAADMRHNLAWLAARRGDLVESFRRFDAGRARLRLARPEQCGPVPRSRRGAPRRRPHARGAQSRRAIRAEPAGARRRRRPGRSVDAGRSCGAARRDDGSRRRRRRRSDGQVRGPGPCGLVGSCSVAWKSRSTCAREGPISPTLPASTPSSPTPRRPGSPPPPPTPASSPPSWPRRGATCRPPNATSRPPGQLLGLAARCRRDLVAAQLAASAGRRDEALAICAATADEFTALTSALGGTELRAHIALHVAAVVDLGLALSLQSGDAELAFAWSERQRASALATPPVRPPEEGALAHDLDRLRAAITDVDVKVARSA